MLFLVPVPVGTIVILVVLYFTVAQHFLLFLFTVGPVAAAGMLFVRWCWDRQDKRRARKLARMENQLVSKEQK